MKNEIFNFENLESLDSYLCKFIKKEINSAISYKGFSSIALSGGMTPLSLYSKLGKSNIDWSKVHLSLVDERCVKQNSNLSNENNIIQSFSISRENFRSFSSFEVSYKNSRPYLLNNKIKNPTPFDFILLGMGLDGHFASIFPNTKELNNLLDLSFDEQISISKTNDSIPYRVTLTLRSILESKKVLLMIQGEDKVDFLSETIRREFSEIQRPIKKLLDQTKVPIYIFQTSN